MDCIYAIDNSHDYLFHHGIKGQHWGERRYQNQDGTYTDEGKKRRRYAKQKQKELRKLDSEIRVGTILGNSQDFRARELARKINLKKDLNKDVEKDLKKLETYATNVAILEKSTENNKKKFNSILDDLENNGYMWKNIATKDIYPISIGEGSRKYINSLKAVGYKDVKDTIFLLNGEPNATRSNNIKIRDASRMSDKQKIKYKYGASVNNYIKGQYVYR